MPIIRPAWKILMSQWKTGGQKCMITGVKEIDWIPMSPKPLHVMWGYENHLCYFQDDHLID